MAVAKTLPPHMRAHYPHLTDELIRDCPKSLSFKVLNLALDLRSRGEPVTFESLNRLCPGNTPKTVHNWLNGLRRIGVLPRPRPQAPREAGREDTPFEELATSPEVQASRIENNNTRRVFLVAERLFARRQRVPRKRSKIPTSREISRITYLQEGAVEVHIASLIRMNLGPWCRKRGKWRSWKTLSDTDRFRLHYGSQAAVLISGEGR